MIRTKHLSRRAVLRGAGGVAITLPWLQLMGPKLAYAAGEAPRRFVVFFSGNGPNESGWPSSANLAGTSLAPLIPHWSDVIVTRGVEMASAYLDPNPNDSSHYNGTAHCLIANHCFRGPDLAGRVGGAISVDQYIASRVSSGTRFASSMHGVRFEQAISYMGPNRPTPVDSDPRQVFARLFTDLNADPQMLQQARIRQQSILDFARSSTQRLQCRLGAEDRARLDQHLSSIRELERTLSATGPSGNACSRPAMPGTGLDYPATGRAQIDLLTTALACDLTRVGLMQYSNPVSMVPFPWLGINDAHHEITHGTSPEVQAKVRKIDTWYAEQFAYLLSRLKSLPEGNGSVLDNTAIIWVSECGMPTHNRRNLAFVMAGRAGGRLRTGQFLRFNALSHANLYVELINAVMPQGQAPVTTFGNPAVCTGGVSEIRA